MSVSTNKVQLNDMGGNDMNKLSIMKSFGLNCTEIEPNVFKVINTSEDVNIDKLQWGLEDCILITSLQKRTEKLDSGIHTMIANVYYIIMGSSNKEVAYRYDDKAAEEFGKTLYKAYKYKPSPQSNIDTIYKVGEY